MSNLGYSELESLWEQAGGSKATAPIAAAIALAESGGNPASLNPNDSNGHGGTQSSYGLWQVSSGTHNPPAPGWESPEVNAQLAVAKWKAAKGFSPWGTFTSGAYKQFVKGGAASAAGSGGGGITSSEIGGLTDVVQSIAWGPMVLPFHFLSGAASTIGDVGTAIAAISHTVQEFVGFFSWFMVPSHWVRIICFMLGVPMVGAGLFVMTKGSLPLQQTVANAGVPVPSTVGSFAPALGILYVSIGSVLLFVAFHNLDAEGVYDFPTLLEYLNRKVSAGTTSKEVATTQ